MKSIFVILLKDKTLEVVLASNERDALKIANKGERVVGTFTVEEWSKPKNEKYYMDYYKRNYGTKK